jgi:hypothetical protein
MGDISDPNNTLLVEKGILFWDNSIVDDLKKDFVQLSPDAPNEVGDVVVYFRDLNNNGKLKGKKEMATISHSARVYDVDSEGYTTSVIAKCGQDGISINHPRAPGYYFFKTEHGEIPPDVAYFRRKK